MNALALLAGLIFGGGLLLSGMTDPGNVLAFLDFTGAWDPRLALVMGSAILVGAPAFWWARRRGQTLAGTPLRLPARWPPDPRLLSGAALFGLGWGLSGLCPGPALVGAAGGSLAIAVFVLAMAAGMSLTAALIRHMDRQKASQTLSGRGLPGQCPSTLAQPESIP